MNFGRFRYGESPRVFTNGIHKERQCINRVDEVGRTVPVSRLGGRTRGIEPARRGRLALPVISRWERRKPGGFRFPSGRFATVRVFHHCKSVPAKRICGHLRSLFSTQMIADFHRWTQILNHEVPVLCMKACQDGARCPVYEKCSSENPDDRFDHSGSDAEDTADDSEDTNDAAAA